jgi:hypothetical protein
MNLFQRAQATRPVIAQFDRPFDWKRRTTCVHMLRAQLVAMGHTPPPVPLFTSPQGAWRALRKRGHDSLSGLVDSLLPQRRIPPACMIVGDVAIAPGVLGAVLIETGNGLIGWSDWDLSRLHEIKIDRSDLIGAWRL